MRQTFGLYVFILVALLLYGCCSAEQESLGDGVQAEESQEKEKEDINSGGDKAVTVTDTSDREININHPVERVAILDNGTGGVLKELGGY